MHSEIDGRVCSEGANCHKHLLPPRRSGPYVKPHPKSLDTLHEILAPRHGLQPQGIYSVCSSHPTVLEAGFRYAASVQLPLLIESTSNQVNQEGGYTGLKPEEFANSIDSLRAKHSFPPRKLILGGDHLGPGPWKSEAAEPALSKAKVLVRDCVIAGYRKIHLDASMRLLGDDPQEPLPLQVSAQRTAELCKAAESAYEEAGGDAPRPCYVIGSEVPTPGGVTLSARELQVTSTEDLEATLRATKTAFLERGLDDAWKRVWAVVVQPGIEFGDQEIHEYDRRAARKLSTFIESHHSLVYEAHSTDYQGPESLAQLVEDHFAILKVGPALTFAYREAILALGLIEEELLGSKYQEQGSQLRSTLEEEMLANPNAWKEHYVGSNDELRITLFYSLSDRIRYYWPRPRVQDALKVLFHNLGQRTVPLSLVSQYLPYQYEEVRSSKIRNEPSELVFSKIRQVLSDYAVACRLV